MPKHERFPRIEAPQVALCHVDTWTGHLLTLTGNTSCQGDQADCFLTFGTTADAMNYADRKVEDSPEVECAIFDSAGEMLADVLPPWTVDPTMPLPIWRPVERGPWWKVWA
jgi:hypothetical protein